MSATIATLTGVTAPSGNSQHYKLVYATNSGHWWAFWVDSTATTIHCAYASSPGGSWTGGTDSGTLSAAVSGPGDGRNVGVYYANISSTDVIHVAIASSTASELEHLRATISGTTITWGSVNTYTNGANSASPDGTAPVVASDGGVLVNTGWPQYTGHGNDNATPVYNATADTSGTWTPGSWSTYNTDLAANSTYSRFSTPLGSGKVLMLWDNGGTVSGGTATNVRWAKVDRSGTTPTAADVFATTSTIYADDWGAAAVSVSDVHAVRSTGASTFEHRRWNGTSWSAGNTITNQAHVTGATAGIALVSDGTNVYLFCLNTDTGNSVMWCQWAGGSATWSSWQTLQAGVSNARSSLSPAQAPGGGYVGVLWTEQNGSNYLVTAAGLSTIVTGSPALAANAVLTDAGNQIVAPVSLAANAALSESAQIVASGSLAATAALSDAGNQIVAGAVALVGYSVLYAIPPAFLIANSALAVTGTVQGSQVTVNGIAVPILAGTLDVQDAIGQRSTASFTVRDDTGSTVYLQGAPVYILDPTFHSKLFAGYVDNVTQVKRDSYGPGLYHQVQCADGHYLADKRIAATSYSNQTAGYIVNDLLTNYLASEGVTAGTIQAGPTITTALFTYAPVSQCIDAIATQAGFIWWIDANKALQFQAPSTTPAPWTADGTTMDESTVQVIRGNSQYRNSQYLLGGTDVTSSQTEIRNGDGTTRAWAMGYELASAPTVSTNLASAGYVAKTVGIKGVDTGKDFYWAKGDPVIYQDTGGTVLGASDKIKVVYVGQYALVALTRDYAGITSQAATEGGATTGYVESAAVDASVTSSAQGFQSANALLAKYSQQCNTVVFDTLKTGLAPGQLLTVNLPDHNLNNASCLIESVETKDAADETILRYTVTAIQGPTNTNWVAFFGALTKRVTANVDQVSAGQSTVLVILESVSESWNWTEGITETVYACPIPGSTLFPNSTLYPC